MDNDKTTKMAKELIGLTVDTTLDHMLEMMGIDAAVDQDEYDAVYDRVWELLGTIGVKSEDNE